MATERSDCSELELDVPDALVLKDSSVDRDTVALEMNEFAVVGADGGRHVIPGQSRTKEMSTPIGVTNSFTVGFSRHGNQLNGADTLWDGDYTRTDG